MEHTEKSKTHAEKGRKSSSKDRFHPSRPVISREGFMLENGTPSGIHSNRSFSINSVWEIREAYKDSKNVEILLYARVILFVVFACLVFLNCFSGQPSRSGTQNLHRCTGWNRSVRSPRPWLWGLVEPHCKLWAPRQMCFPAVLFIIDKLGHF